MSLVNFDKLIYKKKENALKNKHSLCPTWDNKTFRCLFVGPSGCGKTNTLLNLLLRLMNYQEIHILTKMIDEPAYEFLQETLEPVEKKVGHQIVHMYDNHEDMPEVADLDPSICRVVVFDDQVSEKDQSKIVDYFTLGRKTNCGIFYLSQSYYKVPKIIREQCNYYAIFSLPSDNEVSRIHHEIANDIPKDKFKRIMQECTKNPGDCIFIDKKTGEHPYRKNVIQKINMKK